MVHCRKKFNGPHKYLCLLLSAAGCVCLCRTVDSVDLCNNAQKNLDPSLLFAAKILQKVVANMDQQFPQIFDVNTSSAKRPRHPNRE